MTISDPAQQETRGEQLRNLMSIHHTRGHGDYTDEYESFAEAFFPKDVDADPEPIEKYASIAADETYGMISNFDTLTGALAHQALIGESGEYLNVPAGIYDLDTGERVEVQMYAMTPDMAALIAACVAPSSEDINTGGIFSDAWSELQAIFPPRFFHEWAKAHPGHGEDGDEILDPPDPHNYYEPEAGE